MAWNGYDYDKGNFIEIEKGNLVRRGRTIEIYDYDDGQVKFRAYDPEEYFRTYGQVVSDNAGSYHY